MKSIKTNPNSAKGPDKGKIINKLYCILLATLKKRIYKKLRCNSTVKIRFGRKKILNYAYIEILLDTRKPNSDVFPSF
jgi:hypothetical protein